MNTEKFYHDSAINAYEKYLGKIREIHARSYSDPELTYPACLELMREAVCAVTFLSLGLESTINGVFKRYLNDNMTLREQYLIRKMMTSYSLISKINYLKILPPRKIERIKSLLAACRVLTHSTGDTAFSFSSSPDINSWLPPNTVIGSYEIYTEALASLKEKYPQYMASDEHVEYLSSYIPNP